MAFMAPASFVSVFSAEDVEVLAAGADIPSILAELVRRTGVDLVSEPTPDAEYEAFAGTRVDLSMADSLAAAGEWRPDLIVHDPYDYLGPLVAAALDVPTAVVTLGPEVSKEFRRAALAKVAPRYEARGLTPRPASRVLDVCPPALQCDEWQEPEGWMPLRPEAHRSPDGAARESVRPLTRSPRLLVTFGTVFGNPEVLSPILRELAATGAGLRVTLGLTASVEDFDVDHNLVSFESFVSLAELLRNIDLVVTHGGAGSTLSTLAAGIPLVMVPQGADQPVHAGRAAAAGAALQLPPETVTPEAVAGAVATVLGDPSFRDNARKIAEQIAAMPSPDEVAATLASALH